MRAGLLKRQESGKPAFPALKRAFRLLVDGVDDRAPADIAYAFSGYAPLLVRCALVLPNIADHVRHQLCQGRIDMSCPRRDQRVWQWWQLAAGARGHLRRAMPACLLQLLCLPDGM